MLLLLITDNPPVSYLTKWFECFWSSTVTLSMMFFPKFQMVHLSTGDVTALRRPARSPPAPCGRVDTIHMAARIPFTCPAPTSSVAIAASARVGPISAN